MIKAIVLDMYGVIVKQTGDDFVPYVQQFFPDLTPKKICTPWFKADVGLCTSLEVWEALGFRGDMEQIEKEYLDTIEINDGFFDFVLRAGGRYKLAIISNDSSRWSQYLRGKFDINRFFEVISISGDLRIQKPDARIFQRTIDKLGCKAEECLYVDDRVGNLDAASEIGMKPVLFGNQNVQYKGNTVDGFAQLAQLIEHQHEYGRND